MAEIERARVGGVEGSIGAFFEVVGWKGQVSECGENKETERVYGRVIWIMSNQRMAFSSLPSTALRVPLSERTVALGGRLRILSSMCRISAKCSDWL